MSEMIEKLKKNLARYDCLGVESHECLEGVGKENTYTLYGNGEWLRMQSGGPWHRETIYRIVEDYQPKPDTPVFPGYVVVIAEWDSDTAQIIKNYQGNGQQFVGYVFKEKPDVIVDTPIKWARDDGSLYSKRETSHDFKPATLGWVVFKE